MALCQAGSQPVTMTASTIPERIQSQYATSELFGLLGVRAAMGHTFFDREERQTGGAIVLSHSFWHRRFGDDPHVIGKSIVMSDNVYQIIGVMPKGLQIANFGVETDTLLALMGGLVGLGFASWSNPLLSAIAPAGFDFLRSTAIDLPVCAFTLSISVLAGVVIGFVVSLHASHPDPNFELKQGSRGTTSVETQRVRSALTVSEIALAFLLLVGTGLLIRTLLNLSSVRLGFDPKNILTAQVGLSGPNYVKVAPRREVDMRSVDPRVEGLYQNLIDRAGVLPGVESVGIVSWLPMGGWGSGRRDRSFCIIGAPPSIPGEQPAADYNAVGGRYFEAMRSRLLKGCYPDERDAHDTAWIVVVNEAFARRFWPNQDPLGKSLLLNIVAEEKPRQIVGVVDNVRQELPSFDSVPESTGDVCSFPAAAEYLHCHGVQNRLRLSIVLRSSHPMAISAALRKAMAGLDGKQPLLNVQTMDDVLGNSTAPARFFARVLGVFGLMAFALAVIGFYGLMSCNVAERTKEFGIRLALGAPRMALLRDVLEKAALLAIGGIVSGALLSMWLNRVLVKLLYGVGANDLLSFVAVSFLLFITAVVAALQPAWKALRTDPIAALRAE